jgi:hypothetical protein
MPEIVITLDADGLLSPETDARLVQSVGDYAPACVALRQALHDSDSRPLKLLVRHRAAGMWLTNLAHAYGERIRIRRYTPRDALREHWRLDVPPQVTDDQILQAGLLREQVTPRSGQSFEDVLLEHFYHSLLAYPAFPAEQFGRLVTEYDLSRWKDNERRMLVADVYREHLRLWESRELNEGRRWLIAQFRANPEQLRNLLLSYQVLRRYPADLGEKVLGETAWKALQKSGLTFSFERIPEEAINEARVEIQYFLTAKLAELAQPSDLVNLLDKLSGHLLIEFNIVEQVLSAHPDWATSDLLKRVERLFAPSRSGLLTRLSRLRRILPPPYPAAPSAGWTVEQWLPWVRDEYMPYRVWLDDQRREDAVMVQFAEQFADWYFANILDLRNTAEEHFAYAALYQQGRRLRQTPSVGLIVLLDNFNYARFASLAQLFNQQGFSLTVEQPVLSLIPTATEVGKASLIATKGDRVEVPEESYSNLAVNSWQPVLGAGKSVKYLPNVGELQALRERTHDLYILNHLAVDIALHSSSKTTGLEHVESIDDLLRALVSSIIEFMLRFQLEQRLHVFIVSDHGSTRIARKVVNAVDRDLFKDVADIRHHRYLALADKKFEALPQVAESQCYLVSRQRFKTKYNYLIARSYYRFSETDEDFYVHGGLTPEEVVVPIAHFEPKPLDIKAPTFRLLGNQFRYAVKSTLRFEIGNPNSYPLENVRVILAGLGDDELIVDRLKSNTKVEGALTHVFKRGTMGGNSRELVFWVYYDCQGRNFGPVDFVVSVTLKALMETRDDFDL